MRTKTDSLRGVGRGLVLMAMLSGCAWGAPEEASWSVREADLASGPVARFAERAGEAGKDAPLRILTVEERVGVGRRAALVRAPVFFAAGEVEAVETLRVVPAAGGEPRVVQFDDVRLGAGGGVARAHVWFEVDLEPGERKTFHLVRADAATEGAARKPPGPRVRDEGAALVIEAGEARWRFERGGRLTRLEGPGGLVVAAPDGLAPELRVRVRAEGGKAAQETELSARATVGTLAWSRGPLFAKVRLDFERDGVVARLDHRFDRHGRGVTLTGTVRPPAGARAVVLQQDWWAGALSEARSWTRRREPAGLREMLASQHAMTFDVLGPAEGAGPGLMAVPVAWGGASGRLEWDDGKLRVTGARSLANRGDAPAGTLHAFWSETQVRLLERTDASAVRQAFLAEVQPLVAVVDEPGVDDAVLQAALRALVREMRAVNWRQEAGRWEVLGEPQRRDGSLKGGPKEWEHDAERLERGSLRRWQGFLKNGRKAPAEHEKGRAAGALDPYDLTYSHSAVYALQALGRVPEEIAGINAAYALASRRALGRVDKHGWPYLDSFNRALNMQMGATLAGLINGEAGAAAFYRDLATAAPTAGVYGRGQRPYTGATTTTLAYSDVLYQGVVDFWIRAAELLADEDLQLHPLAFSRYTDAVDVTGDTVTTFDEKDVAGDGPIMRTNFFRAQPHTHRWLRWIAAPFLRPLERDGDLTGVTETVHYARALKGRWKNWPDLTHLVLADLLRRDALPGAVRPALLPAATGVRVEASGSGAVVSWEPVAGAVKYRVFRAESPGGPWTWLDSPYSESGDSTPGKAAAAGRRFEDPDGGPGHHYAVLPVDEAGRPGRWRTGEPIAAGGESAGPR